MTLSEYLSKHSMSQSRFSRDAGLSISAITRYLNGERQPDLNALHKIIKATNGEVGLEDFLPDQQK